MTDNLALVYLSSLPSPENDLSHWTGMCDYLTEAIGRWIDHRRHRWRTLYVKPRCGLLRPTSCELSWFFHMAPVIDNLVHDPWFPDLVLPVTQYVSEAFPNQLVAIGLPGKDGDRRLRTMRAERVKT